MTRAERTKMEKMEAALRLCGAALEERIMVRPMVCDRSKWSKKERRAYDALCDALCEWPTGIGG